MKVKGLILFDWDKTIVDAKGAYNERETFVRLIRSKIAEGWYIGLNSDTPLARLKGWWYELGMNGPIIAERGAVVWWPVPEERKVPVLDTAAMFAAIRQEIIARLSQDNAFEGYGLFVGDSTAFVSSVSTIAGNDAFVISVDAYREFSVAMFVRGLSADRRLTYEGMPMAEPLRKVDALIDQVCAPYNEDFYVDRNDEVCFRSISMRVIKKSLGMARLLQAWPYDPQTVYMVGDSIHDYLEGLDPPIRHLAVGNAQDDYLAVAEQSSKAHFTRGCVALLSAID